MRPWLSKNLAVVQAKPPISEVVDSNKRSTPTWPRVHGQAVAMAGDVGSVLELVWLQVIHWSAVDAVVGAVVPIVSFFGMPRKEKRNLDCY